MLHSPSAPLFPAPTTIPPTAPPQYHASPQLSNGPSSPTFPRSTSSSFNGIGQPLSLRPGTSLGMANSLSAASSSNPSTLAAGPVRTWDLDTVSSWLTNDVGVPQLVDTFQQHDITGAVLLDVDQAALKEMGVRAVGERVKITVAIKGLRQRSILAHHPQFSSTLSSPANSRPNSPQPNSFSSPPRSRNSGRIPPPLHLSQSNSHPTGGHQPSLSASSTSSNGSIFLGGSSGNGSKSTLPPPPLSTLPLPPPPQNGGSSSRSTPAVPPARSGSVSVAASGVAGGGSGLAPTWLAGERGRPLPSQPKLHPTSQSSSSRPPTGAPPPRPSTSTSTSQSSSQHRQASSSSVTSSGPGSAVRPATAGAAYGHGTTVLSNHPYAGAQPSSPTRGSSSAGLGIGNNKLLPSPNIGAPAPFSVPLSSSPPPAASTPPTPLSAGSTGTFPAGRGPFAGARPTTPGLDAVMRKAVKFSGEDGVSKMVAVSDCSGGEEVMARVLKKFGKDDDGTYGIFASNDAGTKERLLSLTELLAICRDGNAPERQRGLTVSRVPPSPSHKTRGRKLWKFGDHNASSHSPGTPELAVEPSSPNPTGQSQMTTPEQHSRGPSPRRKMNRASTVSILSSLGAGGWSPATPPHSPNHQRSASSLGSNVSTAGSSSALQAATSNTTQGSPAPSISGSAPHLIAPAAKKLRHFFGQRPPSELIANHLTEYFPGAQKNKNLAPEVRKSVRRSMVRRASQYSVLSAGSGGSGALGQQLMWENEEGVPELPLPRFSVDEDRRSRLSTASSMSWGRRRSSSDGASMITVDDVTAELEERRASLASVAISDEDEVPEARHLRPPSIVTSGVEEESESDLEDDLSDEDELDGEESEDEGEGAVVESSKPRLKWIKGALIGAGSFGSVYLGMNPMSGALMAVKQVELPTGNSHNEERKKSMLDALEREIELLKELQHENIVQYLDSSSDATHLNIFLEYVPGGSVAALLSNYGAFEEALVSKFVKQILTGLEYLHDREIIHRDIKGANILVNSHGGIKISDFGISKRVEDNLLTGHRASLQGSVYWMAPEVVTQKGHTPKADIWSLGCLVVEMLTGQHPWAHLNQMQAIFKIGSLNAHPELPDDVSEEGLGFLEKTFVGEWRERPSAKELLSHPFVTGVAGGGEELSQQTPTRATFKE